MELIAGARPSPWLYDDKLRMNGIKIYLDGALGSRGAWLKQDYADDPGNTGLPLTGPAKLRNILVRGTGQFPARDPRHRHRGERGCAQRGRRNPEISPAIVAGGSTPQIVDPADLPKFAQNGGRFHAACPPDERPKDGRSATWPRPAGRCPPGTAFSNWADGSPSVRTLRWDRPIPSPVSLAITQPMPMANPLAAGGRKKRQSRTGA